MKVYTLTVFEKDGTKLMDENFEAQNDDDAKKIGQNMLEDKGYAEYTHRCVSQSGYMVLFHR
ncbi:YhzD family protein [Thalassobacillus hwangdonensis]|uniref:YhzD family protein n=1 Tax=Thalassobacillus hwangdonensis TaxID=546108 RepID=A0ABW3KZJ8_9BACI